MAPVAMIAVAALFRANAQQPAPPVYFSHSTIFVTSETYESFKASPLIKDLFSAYQESTQHADGGSRVYTGLYMSGMQAYLELFKAGPSSIYQKIVPAGTIHLEMWIDHRSLLPLLRDRLGMRDMQTRRDEQNQPWFDFLLPAPRESRRVATSVSGRYPRTREAKEAEEGVTRLRKAYEPDRLFHDVVAYTVAVSAEDREELVRWFRAYGYAIEEDGEKRIATGPEFTFTLIPELARGPRTATIEMTLNREKSGEQTYQIGDSELRFVKNRAILTFRFPKSDHD